MKPVSLVILLTVAFFSCSKKEETKTDAELVGVWKLTEVLADPGDGSGTFHGVNSNKTMEFHTDGTLTSNGGICDMSIDSGSPSSGTYSLVDSTMTSSKCANYYFKIQFKKTGATLIIYYPCIEGCAAKYIKK